MQKLIITQFHIRTTSYKVMTMLEFHFFFIHLKLKKYMLSLPKLFKSSKVLFQDYESDYLFARLTPIELLLPISCMKWSETIESVSITFTLQCPRAQSYGCRYSSMKMRG